MATGTGSPPPKSPNSFIFCAPQSPTMNQALRIQPGLTKIKAQRAAEELLVAVRGPKPINSAWDGSVPEVEQYLKRVMNDPDSYEHVESTVPVARGEYWIVRSTFRGKNAFGGKVINSRIFYIQGSQVVRVSE